MDEENVSWIKQFMKNELFFDELIIENTVKFLGMIILNKYYCLLKLYKKICKESNRKFSKKPAK